MSHELRTPLNAIVGFAEIMEGEMFGPLGTERYRHYATAILQSAAAILRIVEDVLEISRAETGNLVLNLHEVEVGALIAAATRQVRGLFPDRELNLVAIVEGELVARLDPDKAERMIACLLSNAVKFSPEGTPITVTAAAGPGDLVKISVADRGIGMAPEEVANAFAPFVQLDEGISRAFEGAGLGLPLARLLAQLHGGTIGIHSRRGGGTTATVALPRYSAAKICRQPGAAARPARQPVATGSSRPVSVSRSSAS